MGNSKSQIKNVKFVKEGKKEIKNNLDCSNFVYLEKIERYKNQKRILSIKGLLHPSKKSYYKWKDYNQFEKNPRKIPNGFKIKKLSSKIISNKYCGSKQFLKKNNEQYKKIQKELKNWKYYFTHDNGDRSFLVYIKNKDCKIFAKSSNFIIKEDDYNYNNINFKKNIWMYIEPILEIKHAKSICLGKDPYPDFLMVSKKDFDGNSILIETKDKNQFYFIGGFIASFKLLSKNDKIVKYISPILGSDVSYPFALDQKGNYYLLSEGVILTLPKNMKVNKKHYFNDKKTIDPYSIYYNKKEYKDVQIQKIPDFKKLFGRKEYRF